MIYWKSKEFISHVGVLSKLVSYSWTIIIYSVKLIIILLVISGMSINNKMSLDKMHSPNDKSLRTLRGRVSLKKRASHHLVSSHWDSYRE